ncbi:MAG: caspase family protein [Thermoanaerobaculia bacterium]|nr:caspase family protein [Thermoanaerobaculia bacterium]
MKYPNLLFILLLAAALPAQEPVPNPSEKGAAPLASPPPSGGGRGEVRAVIVGISDYQSPQITDLHFAHRDAEVFAEWLQSPAGGNVPADNVQLFTNERASRAAVITALYDLLDVCRPGDQLVFYFSGHGDVETKTRNNPGFLLAHDTPPNVYMAGAINLRDLQDIVGTLSERQVKVLLITDACHAGKLAGSAIGGTQATAYSLQQQFANEVKIMSCQPNEFSLEGEEWGGGRGVFSYHLIDALTGLADKNGDGTVNLLEAGRYLEETVPAATAPHPQMPVTSGDRLATLARVDAASLAALKQSKSGSTTLLSSSGSKGLEDEVLARADSLTRARYHAFKMALKGNKLLENNDSCADAHFRYLIGQEVLAPLHGLMRRNFAVALLDEVQQALNALLADDPYEANNWRYNPDKYDRYPEYLQRAMELLGERHHLQRALSSKKRYFEGYRLARSLTDEAMPATIRDSIRTVGKALLLEAATLEPDAAYIPHTIGSLYRWASPVQTDSLVKYMSQAIELSPAWILPYVDIATEWSNSQNNLDESARWLMAALKINPNSYLLQERLSWLRQWQNRTDESLEISQKMIAEKPDLFNAYATAGVTCLMRKEFLKAEKFFTKAIELDSNPNGNWAIEFTIVALGKTRRLSQALEWGERFVNDSTVETNLKSHFLLDLLVACWDSRRNDLVEQYAGRVEKLNVIGPHSAVAKLYKALVKITGGAEDAGLALLDALSKENPSDGALQIKALEMQAVVASKQDAYRADSLFRKAIEYTKDLSWLDIRIHNILESARFHYGQFLLAQNRDAVALNQFKTGLEEEPLGYYPAYGMALFAAKQGKKNEALDWLEKALDNWYPIPGPILEEPLFKKLRKSKRFKAMMEKHFPDDFKK